MDHMEQEECHLLYRNNFDILPIGRRKTLLEQAGRENCMEVVGFRRLERWGIYTFTAEYSKNGDRYVFVPGSEVVLGWSGDYKGIDPTTRSKISMDLKSRGCDEPEEILRRLTTPMRRVTIPPMLVQVSPISFEGTYGDAVAEFSLPTSDEWEYLCGGGANTLFQWGDRFDFRMGSDHYEGMSAGPRPLEEPNFFGITIAEDPFRVEAVSADSPTFRGGDLGGSVLAGYGPVIGYLPCSPHFIPVNKGPDGSVPSSFLVRNVIRLDVPECGGGMQTVPSEEASSGPLGPDALFNDDRPFPKDYVLCSAMAEDPDIPDGFAVRARHIIRGLTYWIPGGEWTREELESQLRSRADSILSLQDEVGYRMSPVAAASVRDTFRDIMSFYGIDLDPDTIFSAEGWNVSRGPAIDAGSDSELIGQCEIWHQEGENRRIIEAIESLPESERTPVLVSVLARAYNNIGGPDDHAPCRRAVELLESVRDSLADDTLWNYRMGYAYWLMDREPDAIPYLKRAVEKDPDDGDFREILEDCEGSLAFPRFSHCFRERVETVWRRFSEEMPEIERLLQYPDRNAVSERIVDTVSGIMSEAIDGIAFEIGFNGERFELSLSPEAGRVRLFEICELLRRAPAEIRESWDLRAGKMRKPDFKLNTDAGEIGASDIWVDIEPKGEYVSLTLHCPRLSDLMGSEEGMVWWAVSSIMERVLGEIPAMAALDGVTVVTDPPGEGALPLLQLPSRLVDMGFNLEVDAEGYLSNSITYRPEPFEDPDADWRLDIYSGTSRCAPLVNGYLALQNDEMDMLHRDGAVAGFLAYSLESFEGDDRVAEIMGFRTLIERHITENAGRDAVEFIGGATGLHHGYVDFIAWDLEAVINAAKEFLSETDVVRAGFHTFRRGPSSVIIIDRMEIGSPESPILSPDDIQRLESYLGEVDGRYGAMLSDLFSTLVNGINDGRFSSRQAEADLEVALWYSFACINIGDYEHYWQATRWMPASECNASGCGTWFYRYSCALMFCGRLEEAREYAERGTKEEPGYPWIWLQTAKLRAHFGDREGAMDAVAKGLELVPGDYEFETLAGEIAAGAGLERFEYHWIDPASDARLQAGEDPGAEEKRRAIECIVTDPEGAERFRSMFEHEEGTWTEDSPYCSFFMTVRGCRFQVLFRTNMAAISKMERDWMEDLRSRLVDGTWISYARLMRRIDPTFKGEGTLDTVIVEQGPKVSLLYLLPNGRSFTVDLDGGWSPVESSDSPEEPEGTWLDMYEDIKDSLACGIDLDSYFTQPSVSGIPVTVMDVGTVRFPSGRIIACDPLVSLEDAEPFIQLVPPGEYAVRICVVPHERYGDRYACVKVELTKGRPVRYDMAMTGREDLSEELQEGEFFGFGVDAGMGCVVDEVAREAFRRYWEDRVSAEEGIDPYNDLFCDVLERSYSENPEHQREGGDWAVWTVPRTDLGIPIFASGLGDGCYPCYYGYDGDGHVCGIYVLFIDIARDYQEDPGSE